MREWGVLCVYDEPSPWPLAPPLSLDPSHPPPLTYFLPSPSLPHAPGTLTEAGLDLQGIVAVSEQPDALASVTPSSIAVTAGSSSASRPAFLPMSSGVGHLPRNLQLLLATCHGLARMEEEETSSASLASGGTSGGTTGGTAGGLVGDPLDQKLFQATRWELLDNAGHGDDDGGGGGHDEGEQRRHQAEAGGGGGGIGAASGSRSHPHGAEDVKAGDQQAQRREEQGKQRGAGAAAVHTAVVHTYVRPPRSTQRFNVIKRCVCGR